MINIYIKLPIFRLLFLDWMLTDRAMQRSHDEVQGWGKGDKDACARLQRGHWARSFK